MKTRRTTAPAALLGIAGLLLLGLLPVAGASAQDLPVYSATARAAGVEVDVALRPSIFPSLVTVGLPFVRSETTSIAGGSTLVLASQLFPGDLATGGAGCGGLPGSVQAKYPPDSCLDGENEGTTGLRSPPSGEGIVTVAQGRTRAIAGLGSADGLVTTQRVSLRTSPEAEPIGEVRQLQARAIASRHDGIIEQTVESRAQDVTIAAGSVAIVIDSFISRAHTTSDGITSTADASLTLGDVSVRLGSATYAARIDNRGVHIDEPLPTSLRERLEVRLQHELATAGIDIRLGRPVEITDGARAEASTGGLIVSVGSAIPSAPIPAAAAQVVATILNALDPELTRNRCGHEIDPTLPVAALCFGLGIVPGPGTAVIDTLTVGSVAATSVGALGYTPPPAGGEGFGDGSGGFGDGGTFAPPAPFDPGPIAAPPPPATDGGTTAPPVTGGRGPVTPLFGLVSEMPHTLLLVLGIAFLFLAFGLSAGPSRTR